MSVGLQKRHWHQQSRAAEQLPLASLTCAGAILLGVLLASSQTTISSTQPQAAVANSHATNAQTGAAVLAETAGRIGENGDSKATAKSVPAEKADDKAGEKSKGAGERQREGVEIVDQTGEFRVTGDRVLFVTAGEQSRSYVVLENLCLERIIRELEDNTDISEWTISGSVTEYKGANYLIVTHAVQKSARKDSK